MKLLRRLFLALLPLAAAALPAGAAQPETTEIRYQGWTGQVTFPELAEDLGYLAPFMLREHPSRNGLTPAEIKQVTLVVVPPVNGEQALRAGQVDATTLGGVLRDKALERGGIRKLFSDHELFGNFTAGTYVMREKYILENPVTTRIFVAGVAKAIEWARTQPPEVVRARFDGIIAERRRPEDNSTIKDWKSTSVAGRRGLIADKELQVWIDWLAKDGLIKPGQIQASKIRTNEFNPYRNAGAAVASK